MHHNKAILGVLRHILVFSPLETHFGVLSYTSVVIFSTLSMLGVLLHSHQLLCVMGALLHLELYIGPQCFVPHSISVLLTSDHSHGCIIIPITRYFTTQLSALASHGCFTPSETITRYQLSMFYYSVINACFCNHGCLTSFFLTTVCIYRWAYCASQIFPKSLSQCDSE